MHFHVRICRSSAVQRRCEGDRVKEQLKNSTAARARRRQAGFSLIEMLVVMTLILIVGAMVMIQSGPIMATAKMDTAMRQVIDQIRQAREFSITNRRYVKVAFPTAVVGGNTV